MAKQTPAQGTWGQNNLYSLASAYAAKNPGWVPPGTPPTPSTSQLAYGSPVYAPQLAAQYTGLQDTYANLGVSFGPATLPDGSPNPLAGVPQYGGGAYLQGAQNFGIDQNGQQIAATLPDGSPNPLFNPFNQGTMMKQAFEQRKNGTVNSYNARGQLYAGSALNAQNADASNFDQSWNALLRDSHNYYGGLVSKAVAARDNTNINVTGIQGNALNDYTNAHSNDPAPTLPANYGGGNPAAPKTPGMFRRTLTLGGRIANRSGFVNPTLKGPFGS